LFDQSNIPLKKKFRIILGLLQIIDKVIPWCGIEIILVYTLSSLTIIVLSPTYHEMLYSYSLLSHEVICIPKFIDFAQ